MIARRLTLATLVWLCAPVVVALLCGSPAQAARGHVFGGVFGEPCSGEPCGNGQFKEPSGMAVDEATGQVYVLDQGDNRVERFSSAGVYEAQFDGSETPAKAFSLGKEALTGGIAVDNSCYLKRLKPSTCSAADPSNGDVYVTDPGNGVVDKFSPAGAYLGQLEQACEEPSCPAFEFIDQFGRPRGLNGVGVDASGTVWTYYEGSSALGYVARFTNAEPNTFISSREMAFTLGGAFGSPGFAVDSEDDLYARKISEYFAVVKFNSTGQVLLEPFAAEEASAVAVDLSTDEVFLDNVGSVGAFSSNGLPQGRFGSGYLTSGSGLAVNHANETVYVADSATDVVDIFSPEPPSRPTVESESVSDVTANSATLEAEINPRGASTEYHFEYGRCATRSTCAASAYEESAPVPDASTDATFEVQSVSAHPRDLLAGAAYHFRVVAHNQFNQELETVDGEERTFTTQIAGAFALPDARAWEMISPPDKHGALIQGLTTGVTQASANGNAMVFLTYSPTEAEPQGYTNLVQVLSLRGPGGWQPRDISAPHGTETGLAIAAPGGEFPFYSEDLSLAVVQPFGGFIPASSPQALAPGEASEQTAFLRTDYLHGNVGEPCVSSCYRPLVTGAPGYANVPAGTVFGQEGRCSEGGKVICGPEFLGATPDLSHVVLRSRAVLTSTPGSGLYEWSSGRLSLVSVLPENGGPASSPVLGYRDQDARRAVSADGSRVVWTDDSTRHHLYVRDTVRGETVQLDAVRGGSGSNEAQPEFQTASSDGSKVFFTDRQRLTANSGAGPGEAEADLYECEMIEVAGELKCELSDLTPLVSGEGARVHGAVLGASEDGSYVYFVANGAMEGDAGAVHGNCGFSRPEAATCNLYVRHGATTSLVAVLSGEDSPDWAKDESENLNELTARVSPDGRWLAFMSQRSLTGYDNRDALSGKPDEEVYLYDASLGRVLCASCNPTGARPAGVEYKNLGVLKNEVSLAGGEYVWDGTSWLAANVPGWTKHAIGKALYQSRYLSDDGRLFFNSHDALVPQDVNGTEDVYEYEPPGVGSCTFSAATFSESSGGCVGMVSSGSSAEESAFMDASASGGDVFFVTAARLTPQDYDTALDVYDAHECTGQSPCLPVAAVPPPPCTTGDSCKPAPSPQPALFGSPASATFSGAGNVAPAASSKAAVRQRRLTRAQKLARALRACHKKRARRRAVCKRDARRRYATRASRRAAATQRGRG